MIDRSSRLASHARPPRRAIILAAGRGSRLVTGEDFPKPLKLVAGVPLIVRILRTLQAEGIREAVVVIGYLGDQIRRALVAEPSLSLTLHFVENDAWEQGANGISVLRAKDWLDEDCILSMADHLYSGEIVRRLREADLGGGCALGVDRAIERCFDLDDATKVALDGDRIRDIGKELAQYDAIDTGVFRVNALLAEELAKVFARKGDCSLSDGVRALSASGRFVTVDVGDARWVDVDTPEAHAEAEAMIRALGDGLGGRAPAASTVASIPDPDSIEQFAPSWVRAARPYDDEHLRESDGLVRMMANEAPWPPSPRVRSAILSALEGGHRYPVPPRALVEKLAAREGVDPDGIVLGAGATELVDVVVRTFVAPGEEVVIAVPTFSMYEARTRLVGGIPVLVRIGEELDVAAIAAAITERTKLVVVCAPNNPTGADLDLEILRRVLSLGLPTVIDEAYVELVDRPSHARALAAHPNAIVLRTFSKAFGLAGLRVGWSACHPVVARLLARTKLPWSIDGLALAAADAALDDDAELAHRRALIDRGRAVLERELPLVPGVVVIRGSANFVLCDTSGTGLSSAAIVAAMEEEGVLVRALVAHHLDRRHVRITVGTPDENAACVRALRAVVARHAPRPSTRLRAVAPDAE
jgi:histidinol-phosphate aminotransferase